MESLSVSREAINTSELMLTTKPDGVYQEM